MRSFCKKNHIHKIPRYWGGYFGFWGGGGEVPILFYGREDFSEQKLGHRSGSAMLAAMVAQCCLPGRLFRDLPGRVEAEPTTYSNAGIGIGQCFCTCRNMTNFHISKQHHSLTLHADLRRSMRPQFLKMEWWGRESFSPQWATRVVHMKDAWLCHSVGTMEKHQLHLLCIQTFDAHQEPMLSNKMPNSTEPYITHDNLGPLMVRMSTVVRWACSTAWISNTTWRRWWKRPLSTNRTAMSDDEVQGKSMRWDNHV